MPGFVRQTSGVDDGVCVDRPNVGTDFTVRVAVEGRFIEAGEGCMKEEQAEINAQSVRRDIHFIA